MPAYQNNDGLLISNLLSNFEGLIHGITTKSYGNMSSKRITAGNALEGRNRLSKVLGIRWEDTIFPEIEHGTNVGVLRRNDDIWEIEVRKFAASRIPLDRFSKGYDAIITQEKNCFLALAIADCAPVFVYDPFKQVIGLVHSGLSGTVCGVVVHTLQLMRQVFDSNYEDLLISIGPCISRKYFDISRSTMWNEVLEPNDAFNRLPKNVFFQQRNALMFDIRESIKNDLMDLGVKTQNLEISELCTVAHRHKLYSHYAAGAEGREAQNVEGRFLAIIGMQ